MKKHGVLALVLAGVMLLLCGCGGMTTDDAMDYVQSALDCGYKAEVKKYAEITETTEKEAKKEYETNLDTIMKEAGFDEVCPFTAFSTVSDELDQWVTDTYSNVESIPSDEELNEAIMRKMYEIMSAKLADPTYGDKMEKEVHVKVNKDGAYYIPNDDLTAVDDALFPQNQL